jgi:GrpB-like predicted nucleotidyltransferase (UPF0157 family)
MMELVDTSSQWGKFERLFQEIKFQIALAAPHARIEHIGSTSILGALTKGDLDIAVIVERSILATVKAELDKHFVHNKRMPPTATFVSYCGVIEEVEFGIQLYSADDGDFDFVEWREALRNSPALLDNYNHLKKNHFTRGALEYQRAKTSFIEENLQKIREGG